MKILVIDDCIKNQKSAFDTLVGHDLTVCGTVEEAFSVFEGEHRHKWRVGDDCGNSYKLWPYDVVLTDLWMPLSKPEGGYFLGQVFSGNRYLRHGEDMGEIGEVLAPVGLAFALRAVILKTTHVVIVTNASRHSDRMTTLLDMFVFSDQPESLNIIDRIKVLENGAKDWGYALEEHLSSL
jgi:hypothetical protein